MQSNYNLIALNLHLMTDSKALHPCHIWSHCRFSPNFSPNCCHNNAFQDFDVLKNLWVFYRINAFIDFHKMSEYVNHTKM